MVEHGTENAGVDSSILSLGTIPPISLYSTPTNHSESPGVPNIADIFYLPVRMARLFEPNPPAPRSVAVAATGPIAKVHARQENQ